MTGDPGKAWRAAEGVPVVPAFDGFRALAIIAVVLFHVFQISGVFASFGSSAAGIVSWGVLPRGLDAFFIISGFVIYLPTVARGGDFGPLREFALRRAARLVPAYWAVLAVAIVLLATLSAAPGAPSAGSIALHSSFLQTPALLFDGGLQLGFGVVPPVWTLSVEVGFYLLVPLFAAWYFRHPLAGLAAAALLLVAWHAATANADSIASLFGIDLSAAARARIEQYSGSQLPSWAVALAAGMTSAWAYVRARDRFSPAALARLSVRALAASSVVLAVFIYLAGHQAVTDPSPLNGLFARQSLLVAVGYPAALAAAMLALALCPERAQRPVANRPIRWFADISYGVYLIHFAVIWFALLELSLPQTGSAWSALVWGVLVLAVSIGYAYLSARFLERPIRRLARRVGGPGARPSESHAPA